MNPLLKAIRAVSTEFARRIFVPLVWIIGSIIFVAFIVGIWLTTLSSWWWLLLVPIIACAVIFTIASLVVGLAIRFVRPQQSKQQRTEVGAFVTKLQQVAEVLQTPKAVLLFRLAKDTIFPSKDGFIGEVTSHAKTVKPDFQAIVNSFK